ncbi:3'-5' exonuclease [Streptomyces sp. NPDC001817]|uniref:3'-5' exonuclease n=1 Tax=Streptomyces sp. NPDC001817 TaxID=3154398 RepID=UPI003316CC1C
MWDDLFVREVDERRVQFVRALDTDRPMWAAYQAGVYLGTVTAEPGSGRPLWRVLASGECYQVLDDAVRSLRRPASWPRERDQAARWARNLLADVSLAAVDIETTGLDNAFAVQIAVVTPGGTVLCNEYVRPDAVIEPDAVAVHGITPDRVVRAATFGELLPRLTRLLHGRTLVSCNAVFDRGVFERELTRHQGSTAQAAGWLARVRWEDAMTPYAAWHGLWSAKRGTYRNQPLGGPHDAVADCHLLLAKLKKMAATVPPARG